MNSDKSNLGAPITPNEELLIINFDSEFNKTKYIFSLFDIGNDSIKIIATDNIGNQYSQLSLNKFGITLQLEELKNLHRYFRQFEDFEEAKSYIVELCKANSIKIIEVKENELTINVDLKTIQNDSMIISMNKIKNNKNGDISFIIQGYKQQNEEIKNLKNTIDELKIIISNLTKRIEKLEEKNNNNIINNFNSNIIKNKEEIDLLFNAISNKTQNLYLNLLYNSEIDGENTEKLKSEYLGKNDILILIQTKKGKRFGGYAHEAFHIYENFKKKDNRAFLFNLDKKKIYKSKGDINSIWNYEGNSIDFGTGTDLRIFHDFFQKENYTAQTSLDYSYDEKYALNGEKFFEIKILEIYQIIFN